MPARTGAQFLRDRRVLWLGGQRVTDPTGHLALRGAADRSQPGRSGLRGRCLYERCYRTSGVRNLENMQLRADVVRFLRESV